VLRELQLWPADPLSAFVVGSTARGWAHGTSDVDLVVVSDVPFTDDRVLDLEVPLEPHTLPVVVFEHHGRRCEVKYWLDRQVDQLFDKVSWAAFEADRTVGSRLWSVEQLFLARLGHCLPLSGRNWIDERRTQLDDSAFRTMVVSGCLATSDSAVRAAVGQLAAHNVQDAVLLARTAFEASMEALLGARGDLEASPKWRARRFRAAAPEQVTFEQYWSIQTMRDLDPASPAKWINMVLELCQSVSLEIEL
jgi:hypothetical protein